MRHALHHGVFLREAGSDAPAPSVLWIHGLGESGLCFEQLCRHPALESWPCLVPDLPGYGRSGQPRRAYSLPFFQQAMLELLDALEIERATLVPAA